MGPDFRNPAPPAPTDYGVGPSAGATATSDKAGADQIFEPGGRLAGDWWTLFHSPGLNGLVEAALRANPDVAAAKAGLRAARETDLAQRGAFLPSAEANYNVTRQQASATPAPPLASNENLFTLHTATLTVAYAPDVFGGARRQAEATRAQADVARWQAEAAYLSLTSNLVLAALQDASLKAQIDATQQIIAEDETVARIVRRQHALGQISGADEAAQETLLAQARALLPPLQKQRAIQRDLIADLAGRAPGQGPLIEIDLDQITLPTHIPVSLPAQLVQQRPDILAATANLHVASAQVGVAIANRLPSLQLAASAGGAATDISSLLANGNSFWNLAAGVTQPIFEGGALLHRQRAAEATLDQAKQQYRSTVLAGLQNVADCLQALNADASALSAAAEAQASADRSLAIAKAQHEQGQTGMIDLLNAEQAQAQARLALIAARASRYSDTAALFAALGGGWWERDDFGERERHAPAAP